MSKPTILKRSYPITQQKCGYCSSKSVTLTYANRVYYFVRNGNQVKITAYVFLITVYAKLPSYTIPQITDSSIVPHFMHPLLHKTLMMWMK